MGNCWPKPIDNQPSIVTSSNPVHANHDGKEIKNRSQKTHVSPPRGDRGGGVQLPESGKINTTPNLKMFTFAQLRSATRDFRPDSVLGKGGFGTVFKGWVDEKTYAPSRVGVGIPVAVKKSNPDSEQGLKEWQAEVKFLGKFSHPNLVKLLGYCWENKQFLLVYEYMQKGSLANHLFRKGGGEPIPWDTRIKIAIGAARGAAFLHTIEKQVIYRDFKAANILLDEEFNAKLSDFGLAKLGPSDGKSHITTDIVGTFGYAAPEYMATGHLYVKSDVFGFGVVLLEIITGLEVIDLNRPNKQMNLVDWAKPMLCRKNKLKTLIDPRLNNEYPSRAAFQVSELILQCLEPDPKCRPNMKEVLEMLDRISTIRKKPKESKPKTTQSQWDVKDLPLPQWTPRDSNYGKGSVTGTRVRRRSNEPNSY